MNYSSGRDIPIHRKIMSRRINNGRFKHKDCCKFRANIIMRIVETHSHFNGLEHLLVHKPQLWQEIKDVIQEVGENTSKTTVSKERNTNCLFQHNPVEMNKAFKSLFEDKDWTDTWVAMSSDQQKEEIERAGLSPMFNYNQTDFIKDRVAIEVQFGKYSFGAYDLFVKHLAFYIDDKIDVGIAILPMKQLQNQMNSGVSYYEGELYNVISQGRGVPAVPVVIVGIEE